MNTKEQQLLSEIQRRYKQGETAWHLNDIALLLSLIKSQEAVGGDAVSRQEVITRIEREIRLWHNDTVTMACADMLAELKQMPAVPDAATSMRSACVEKVKETHDSVESACNTALMDVYDLSIANAPIPAKDCREIADCIGDRVGQIRKAIAALTEALESLSIEKPKE